jgi:hypothetical protein
MSANDYYNPTSRQNQTPQPYYQSYNPQPPPLSGPPSYHSQTPSLHPSLPSRNPSVASPVSPFEAPFDDHVYPAGGLDGQHRMDSQSTLGADSRYYGQGGGGRQDSLTSFRDDIPLRDHPRLPPKSNVDMNDHVYDAGDPTVPPHLMEEARPKRRRLRGMVGLQLLLHQLNTNFSSRIDRIPNRNPSSIQSHDRSFAIHSNQHGGSIYALHAQRSRYSRLQHSNWLELPELDQQYSRIMYSLRTLWL